MDAFDSVRGRLGVDGRSENPPPEGGGKGGAPMSRGLGGELRLDWSEGTVRGRVFWGALAIG